MTHKEMYPSMTNNEKQYPSVEMPMSMMSGITCKPGDKCEMKVKGEIENIDKKYFRVRLKEGEMSMSKEEKK